MVKLTFTNDIYIAQEKRIVYTDKSKRKKGMTVLERVTLVIEDISQVRDQHGNDGDLCS